MSRAAAGRSKVGLSFIFVRREEGAWDAWEKGDGRSQEVFGGKVRVWGGTRGAGSGLGAAQAWGLGACRGRERAGTLEGHRERGGGR